MTAAQLDAMQAAAMARIVASINRSAGQHHRRITEAFARDRAVV